MGKVLLETLLEGRLGVPIPALGPRLASVPQGLEVLM
jgi:hypothetical protein